MKVEIHESTTGELVGVCVGNWELNRRMGNNVHVDGHGHMVGGMPVEETMRMTRAMFYKNPNELLGAQFTIKMTYDDPGVLNAHGALALVPQVRVDMLEGCWLVGYRSQYTAREDDAYLVDDMEFRIQTRLDGSMGSLCMSLPGEKTQEIIEWEERWHRRKSQ